MMRVIKDCHSCRIIPFAYASGIFLIYIILEAYRTGKGRIVVRGKTDIPHQTDKSALVEKIAELVENKREARRGDGKTPQAYLCLAIVVKGIRKVMEAYAKFQSSLEGISDIRDESDRSGMRVVIELKQGSDPSIVLNNLYRLTSLQCSFSCNMVGFWEIQVQTQGNFVKVWNTCPWHIHNGQPKQMGLKELLQVSYFKKMFFLLEFVFP
ncbi:unnamed protein product [Prunus armeniaca]|uniref:Topo IIA-type catalytic domain-containing protein n=1 Tax=Prunus armeniaca TaxID=36596 RepID=A0A6J5WHF6_PRUAR|nr:unnamed protein product [Prunus armeniaca]CAB4299042.1 unnamed protein product [Prunus armeniaca]